MSNTSGIQDHYTVCLLGVSLGTCNMGVNALLVGAVTAIVHRWPSARVFLLDYDHDPKTYTVDIGARRVRVPLVNMRFSKRVWLRNHVLTLLAIALLRRLIPSRVAREWLTLRSSCLKALDEADIVASVAGGDSFSDIYGFGRFFYVALPQLLCLLAGKRLVLMPQTLGPFQNRLVRTIAAFILRHSELVYSRDYPGLNYARRLIRSAPDRREPQFCPDLGLLLEPSSPDSSDSSDPTHVANGQYIVGLNVSGLLATAGGDFAGRRRFKTEYNSLIRRLIDFLIASRHVAVVIIPHVFGESAESDTRACKRLYDEMRARFPDDLRLAGGVYDQHQIKRLIGSCDIFIGSRMHACIAAVSQCVPAISLAYSDKFVGVMSTMGLSCLVADLRSVGETEILAIVDSALDSREEHRSQLERRIPGLRTAVLNLFHDID